MPRKLGSFVGHMGPRVFIGENSFSGVHTGQKKKKFLCRTHFRFLPNPLPFVLLFSLFLQSSPLKSQGDLQVEGRGCQLK